MDFELSDEQRLLKDSAARYVRERCSFESWRRWRSEGRQPADELWSDMAEMGWLALPFAAADGGLDGGPLETMLLMEALGHGLLAEPYLQSVVQAGEVLRGSPRGPWRSARIAELIEGRSRLGFACDELTARYSRDLVRSTAERAGDGWCESPRVLRRLQLLRRWSYEQVEQVLT
ncbi:acyl-CoA dehydrogenase family protein [Roseateles toxinivorans]|uniref:acyl-CoA dehydrogenase family protein n=1 Tax=Roseateles toxinivorans TaxID=270368 RepID=UPI0010614293|nr:acyl-CoA dehydrogenase family protein [Roseateles toxinivorans]